LIFAALVFGSLYLSVALGLVAEKRGGRTRYKNREISIATIFRAKLFEIGGGYLLLAIAAALVCWAVTAFFHLTWFWHSITAGSIELPPWLLLAIVLAVWHGLQMGKDYVQEARLTIDRSRDHRSAAPHRGAWVTQFSESDWDTFNVNRQKSIQEGKRAGLPVRLVGVPVPFASETRHFKIMGATGSGKSTAIRTILKDAAYRGGDRAIIADPDGGYLSRFYDPARGDIILNPFDARSVNWDIFEEIENPYDVEQMARSIIPEHGNSGAEWTSYARTFFSSLLKRAKQEGFDRTSDLYDFVTSVPKSDLAVLLQGTAAATFLDVGADKMFAGVRSTTADAVRGLEYLKECSGPAFSIKKWIREGKGWLFLPYQADQIAAIRSLIATWMRLAIFAAMSLPEGDAKLWFIVDELDALGKIDGLADALARLRKFGGRCVLGFQSIGPVKTIYGDGFGAAMTENCGNTLILRCSSSDGGGTSHFASKLIGQREVLRTTSTEGSQSGSSSQSGRMFQGSSGSHSGSSTSTQTSLAVEDAVLPSQIEALAECTGYLKMTERQPWYGISFRYDKMPLVAPAFQSRQISIPAIYRRGDLASG
jgi:hypothetical protein